MSNDWETIRAELLSNSEIREGYEKLALYRDVAGILVDMRSKEGLTQKEMAERIGISQSAIARYESGTYNPTLKFLEKVANATGNKVVIRLEKK
ncbi:MAG: helix-turn-helix domain protein [Patescibacteria group bacterium]|jgi:ribosome-binding protein aMBF1 (putative translation factor)|nr:helix-turn-helix domain protein [Patescibacteria group bacterium]